MQFKNVNILIKPLLRGGHQWQNIDLNGQEHKPKLYFSNIQWVIILLSACVLLKLTKGISKEIIGYVMSAFAISVSLFMSLLVSIFDKFEDTNFETKNVIEEEIVRLKQKKNFFKRFISITSYLVVLSILILILCSFTYLFDSSNSQINLSTFTWHLSEINFTTTIRNCVIIVYRIALNYFLLNYLLLTFFITGSAYEYYVSEIDRRKIGQ